MSKDNRPTSLKGIGVPVYAMVDDGFGFSSNESESEYESMNNENSFSDPDEGIHFVSHTSNVDELAHLYPDEPSRAKRERHHRDTESEEERRNQFVPVKHVRSNSRDRDISVDSKNRKKKKKKKSKKRERKHKRRQSPPRRRVPYRQPLKYREPDNRPPLFKRLLYQTVIVTTRLFSLFGLVCAVYLLIQHTSLFKYSLLHEVSHPWYRLQPQGVFSKTPYKEVTKLDLLQNSIGGVPLVRIASDLSLHIKKSPNIPCMCMHHLDFSARTNFIIDVNWRDGDVDIKRLCVLYNEKKDETDVLINPVITGWTKDTVPWAQRSRGCDPDSQFIEVERPSKLWMEWTDMTMQIDVNGVYAKKTNTGRFVGKNAACLLLVIEELDAKLSCGGKKSDPPAVIPPLEDARLNIKPQFIAGHGAIECSDDEAKENKTHP